MSVAKLSSDLMKDWLAIEKADKESAAQLAQVKKIVEGNGIDSADLSVVVFGSLARREWTSGSDLDWTIVIDGEAEQRHAITAHELGDLLGKAGFIKPGPTGIFGNLTFSHELIHQIGGQDDSNRNTTRRLLLLLESKPVNRREAYDRVIKGILRRYLQNDFRPFYLKVPLFLLNDLNRFWRTMCVDYASKYREQAGKKWALRNVKLRLSRKLIFASGLLTCFQSDPEWIKQRSPQLAEKPTDEGLVEYLLPYVDRSPLDILAESAGAEATPATAEMLFDSYNAFLEKLDQEQIRKHLEELKPEEASSDEVFQSMQTAAEEFQQGLEWLFFDDSKRLAKLTRRYGVF
ncbi:MAG: nucleotidyltransferase domain-containing protein [Planctomycetes bacterium]|nr:nucleotidyltransferase domain-containing protein [Planctomycetota bacterium]